MKVSCFILICGHRDTRPGANNVECRTDDRIAGIESNFICETTQAVASGQELVTAYMTDPLSRSNSRYLIDYGFVPEVNPVSTLVPQIRCFIPTHHICAQSQA